MYDGRTVRRIDVPTPEAAQPIIYSLTPDAGKLWVGTADGVFQYMPNDSWKTPAWSPMFARPNALIAQADSADGQYWLGSQGGLWRTQGDGAPVPVTLEGPLGDGASTRIRFSQPEFGVAPGQAAVIYAGERVIGGGWIETTEA